MHRRSFITRAAFAVTGLFGVSRLWATVAPAHVGGWIHFTVSESGPLKTVTWAADFAGLPALKPTFSSWFPPDAWHLVESFAELTPTGLRGTAMYRRVG